MKKKIVFLPYDFDTAIGINNEGALVFSYNLEDIDHLESGADVFNGQQSVFWQNLRSTHYDQIKEMYQNLRSTGALSYEKVEKMFEEHQGKWPEAVFNEDAWFKYISPLVEEGSAEYLSMLQGSKSEQRKWWLYNRFRYLDSKYNAGDALTDVITLRGYAKDDITVIPYADIYASIKYGSYLVQTRAARNQPYTLACPLDNVNDTEIYIYSSSQLASVGDLSGLMVGYANFSYATKLQELKLGDSKSSYSNGNLTDLYLGNNRLLRTLDVRNCPSLTMTVDISGCRNIENIYFDGTRVAGVTLPNGGIIKVLHLPETVTNLTIRNQTAITDFRIPSYANISTLRLENVGSVVDSLAILRAITAGSRVRLVGFRWEASDTDEIRGIMDILDTMRGLDENGNNMEKAQVSGVIHVDSLTGAELAAFNERYPDIEVAFDHVTSYLYYYDFDGAELLYTESIQDGGDGAYTGSPSKPSTAANTFSFIGWALRPGSTAVDSNALKNVTADRRVYAAYKVTGRTYTVYFYNGSTLLQTVQNVPYGGRATYTGETPLSPDGSADDFPFTGFSPEPVGITGNTSCYAQFGSPLEIAEITDDWDTIIAAIEDGSYRKKYAIGNYKPLDLGSEGIINMQIAAKDKDGLADGSGTAAITWIGVELLKTSHRMNPSLVGKMDEIKYTGQNKWAKSEGEQNKYQSTNQKKQSSQSDALWNVALAADGVLTIAWTVDSENSDMLSIYVDGVVKLSGRGGTGKSGTITVNAKAGTSVTVCAIYQKDSSIDTGTDTATVTFSADVAFTEELSISDEEVVIVPYKPATEGTGTIGGWEKTEMRAYMKETILPLIPENVRSKIKTVTKTHPAYDSDYKSFTQTTQDDIWIPSYAEMFGNNAAYKTLFPDNASRVKKKGGASSASWWWLRGASSRNGFGNVGSSGGSSSSSANDAGAVPLGFSL